MSYGIATRDDAEKALLEALEISTMEQAREQVDMERLVEDCYEVAGCWDLGSVDEDTLADLICNAHIYH